MKRKQFLQSLFEVASMETFNALRAMAEKLPETDTQMPILLWDMAWQPDECN
jgi:hypothetical protein